MKNLTDELIAQIKLRMESNQNIIVTVMGSTRAGMSYTSLFVAEYCDRIIQAYT